MPLGVRDKKKRKKQSLSFKEFPILWKRERDVNKPLHLNVRHHEQGIHWAPLSTKESGPRGSMSQGGIFQ